MYLHGAPAHSDHLKQGEGFHVSMFELLILCSAKGTMVGL